MLVRSSLLRLCPACLLLSSLLLLAGCPGEPSAGTGNAPKTSESSWLGTYVNPKDNATLVLMADHKATLDMDGHKGDITWEVAADDKISVNIAIPIAFFRIADGDLRDMEGAVWKKQGPGAARQAADRIAPAAGTITGRGEAEAVKAVRAELEKRWLKAADGWVSEYPAKTYIATGQRAGPESFYRQIKEMTFRIEPQELSPADKLNGIQFRGDCQFTDAPVRVYGDPMGPAGWSQWKQSSESLTVTRRNGQWLVGGGYSFLLSGTKPTAQTVAQLK